MTFLAHFTGGGIQAVEMMNNRDIRHYYNEAASIYNEINKPPPENLQRDK